MAGIEMVVRLILFALLDLTGPLVEVSRLSSK